MGISQCLPSWHFVKWRKVLRVMLLWPILHCPPIKPNFAEDISSKIAKKHVRSNRCPIMPVYTGLKFVVKHTFGTVIYECKLFNLQYRLWYANSVEKQSNLTCLFISLRDDLHKLKPRSCYSKLIFVISYAWRLHVVTLNDLQMLRVPNSCWTERCEESGGLSMWRTMCWSVARQVCILVTD